MESSEDQQSVHLNFRVPALIAHELEKESKRTHMSANAVINDITAKYTKFDRLITEEHSVTLEGVLFDEIIKFVPAEEMSKFGEKLAPNSVRQNLTFLNIDLNIDSLVSRYFKPMGSFSNQYEFNEMIKGSTRVLLFRHNHGLVWSVYLKHRLSAIIKSITGTQPIVEIENGLVKITC